MGAVEGAGLEDRESDGEPGAAFRFAPAGEACHRVLGDGFVQEPGLHLGLVGARSVAAGVGAVPEDRTDLTDGAAFVTG